MFYGTMGFRNALNPTLYAVKVIVQLKPCKKSIVVFYLILFHFFRTISFPGQVFGETICQACFWSFKVGLNPKLGR